MTVNLQNKPLILVGSRVPLGKIKRVCAQHNIDIAGIIDSDYHGNTPLLEGIPVIDTEKNLKHYKDEYNFFMATAWSPDPAHNRDKDKRKHLIELIEQHGINCISLIDRHSMVDPTAKIGRGVFVDCFCMIEESVVIEDYVSIYNQAGIGHHSAIGKNTVLQGKTGVTSNVTIQDECYLGYCSNITRSGVKISRDTIVHPGITVHRGTVEGEVVSMVGKDLRRVYQQIIVE